MNIKLSNTAVTTGIIYTAFVVVLSPSVSIALFQRRYPIAEHKIPRYSSEKIILIFKLKLVSKKIVSIKVKGINVITPQKVISNIALIDE
ncbi:hypothetical protein H17ap60334_00335 [Thermosipho africanus H17ap60334]|nr:hypothetical protein H17ap60334_00335 [Thermosipho africanus H17ap60334]